MPEITEKEALLLKRVEADFQECVDFTKEFVDIESTRRNEEKAQSFVERTMRGLEMEVDKWIPELAPICVKFPKFIIDRQTFEGSPNVVGVKKGCGGGRSLLLNGHVDVVDPGNANWTTPPFKADIRDGKLYGRGSTDMKGGTAAYIHVLGCLQKLGYRLKGDIILESVVEEETGSLGTLSCGLRGYKADAAIIAEPTDLKVYPASVGVLWLDIEVEGLNAHGGTRHMGVSAIEKSFTVCNVLAELERFLAAEYRHPLYTDAELPYSINVGMINSGIQRTIVPGQATLGVRMPIIPGDSVEETQNRLEKWIGEAASRDPWLCDHVPKITYRNVWSAGNTPVDHPIVQMCVDSYRSVQAAEPVICGALFTTDSGPMWDSSQTPSVIFGPGTGERAHKVDEFIELDKWLEYCKMLALMITRWCGIK